MTKSVQNFWTFSEHFQCKSKNVQKSGQIQKLWTRWALYLSLLCCILGKIKAKFITLVYIFNVSFLFNIRLRQIIFQPLTLHLSPYSNKSWVPLFYCNRGLAIFSCLITRDVFRVTIVLWPFIFSHS